MTELIAKVSTIARYCGFPSREDPNTAFYLMPLDYTLETFGRIPVHSHNREHISLSRRTRLTGALMM